MKVILSLFLTLGALAVKAQQFETVTDTSEIVVRLKRGLSDHQIAEIHRKIAKFGGVVNSNLNEGYIFIGVTNLYEESREAKKKLLAKLQHASETLQIDSINEVRTQSLVRPIAKAADLLNGRDFLENDTRKVYSYIIVSLDVKNQNLGDHQVAAIRDELLRRNFLVTANLNTGVLTISPVQLSEENIKYLFSPSMARKIKGIVETSKLRTSKIIFSNSNKGLSCQKILVNGL